MNRRRKAKEKAAEPSRRKRNQSRTPGSNHQRSESQNSRPSTSPTRKSSLNLVMRRRELDCLSISQGML